MRTRPLPLQSSSLQASLTHSEMVKLVPSAETYAVYGHVEEGGTGNEVACWITASKIDPASPWTEYFKRVPSNGAPTASS